jgi:hypothetical protein
MPGAYPEIKAGTPSWSGFPSNLHRTAAFPSFARIYLLSSLLQYKRAT